MEFHETLQDLLEFLERAEDKFAGLGALGSDIDAVKRQIAQLKAFKSEVDPHMVKVEALNRSVLTFIIHIRLCVVFKLQQFPHFICICSKNKIWKPRLNTGSVV